MGYWPVVSYFTRSEAVRSINGLDSIKTSLGRGMYVIVCTIT